MAAPILWAPGIFGFFLQEKTPMPIKFLLLGGGFWAFLEGGVECQFYFYGRGDFSEFGSREWGGFQEGGFQIVERAAFFLRVAIIAMEFLLKIDTSLKIIATSGLRTNLLFENPPFRKPPFDFPFFNVFFEGIWREIRGEFYELLKTHELRA